MKAKASRRSARLRAKLALIRGYDHAQRGAAFRARKASTPSMSPKFSDLAALPDWLLLDTQAQSDIARAIAILVHRPAIDRELSGQKLVALSDAVGERHFEQLCDCAVSVQAEPRLDLPRPEDLVDIGRDIMVRAIPAAFAPRFAGAVGDASSAALCNQATALIAGDAL